MLKSLKIFISTTTFGKYDSAPVRKLKRKGFAVEMNPYRRKLSIQEQLDLYKDIDGLIAGTERIGAGVLNAARKLKVISRCGAGIDNINLEVAKSRGIKIFNTPDAPTLAVAELTLAVILNLLRRINEADTAVKNGKWNKLMGNLLCGKKVGVIGFGRIGEKVAELVSAFKAEVNYYDIKPKTPPSVYIYKDFEKILGWADILTLHLSVPKDTRYILGSSELKAMKRGSWLINLSRGSVVDEKTLYELIKNGHIAGAAVDVFKQEPYEGPLKELDNVILTPHAGSYAKEARVKMEHEAVDNLLEGLRETEL